MRFHPPRPLLAVAAVAYATSLLLYTGAWIYLMLPAPRIEVELGFDTGYQPAERVQLVRSVKRGSPAEKADVLAGDRILAIDGVRITDEGFEDRIWMQHKPGDQIHLTIQRPGADALVFVTGTFRRLPGLSRGDTFSRPLKTLFPLPFVIVGLAVLLLRLEDPNAWLLALLFGGVAVSRGLPRLTPQPAWWAAAMAYQAVLIGMAGPLFIWSSARFPTSFLEGWSPFVLEHDRGPRPQPGEGSDPELHLCAGARLAG